MAQARDNSNTDNSQIDNNYRDISPHLYWTDYLSNKRFSLRHGKAKISYFESGSSPDQAYAVRINIPYGASPKAIIHPYDLIITILKDSESIQLPFGLRYQIIEQVEGRKVYSQWAKLTEDTRFVIEEGDNFIDNTFHIQLMITRPAFPEPWINDIVEKYTKVDHATNQPPINSTALDKFLAFVKKNYGSVVEDKMNRYLKAYLQPDWRDIAGGGILLYGPPGTGKTKLCEELAKQLGLYKLFWGSAANLNSKYVGDTEKKLLEIAHRARMHPNTLHVMLLDEVHTLASSQKKNESNDGQSHKSDALAVLLNIMSDPSVSNILFLACTNFKSRIDEALTRSRRMSHQLLLAPLSEAQRKEKVEEICSNVRRENNWNDDQVEMVKSTINEYDRNFTIAQMSELESIFKANRSTTFTKQILLSAIHEVSRSSSLTQWPNNSPFAIPEDVTNLSILTRAEHQLKIQRRDVLSVAIRDGLQQAFGFVENYSNGRLQLFASSSMFVSEQSDGSTLSVLLRDHIGTLYTDMVIGAIAKATNADHITIINAKFREEHGEANIAKALETEVDVSRSYEGRSLIIVEVDELAGMVPSSHSITKSHSAQRSVQFQQSVTNTASLNIADTIGGGTTTNKSSSFSIGFTDGVSKSEGKSVTESESTTVTDSITKGKSASVGMNGFTPSFSISVSEQRTHSEAITKGRAETKSEQFGTNNSVSNTFSASDALAISNSWNYTVSKGQQKSKSEMHGLTDSATQGVSSSINIQSMYPKALEAVLRLAIQINRQYNPSDPFVLFVYRLTEPAVAQEVAQSLVST